MEKIRNFLFIFFALLAFGQTTWAQSYITDVILIGGNKNQTNEYKTTLQGQGWTLIDHDLNAGAGGAYIYLLYKTSSSSENAITDFIVKSYNNKPESETLTYDGRTYSLVEGYGTDDFKNNSKRDLNYQVGGKNIHLYYTKSNIGFTVNRTITSIFFDSNASNAVGANGSSTTGVDLNQGAGGDYIYMHAIADAATNPIIVANESQLREAVLLNNANIKLSNDITLTSLLDIATPVTLTIDLNNHNLDRNLSSSAGSQGHVLQLRSTSLVTVKNGSLTNGYADNGGGVWIGSTATLELENVTISNCKATGNGGAICNNGTLKIKGENTSISGNTVNNTPNNVYLPSGKKIIVTGSLKDDSHTAQIRVNMAANTGTFTSGFMSNNASTNVSDVFSSDKVDYYLGENDGEACLGSVSGSISYIKHSWNQSTHSVSSETKTCSVYTVLSGNSSNSNTKLYDGFYVLNSDVTYAKRLDIVGDVSIILCDNKRLTANGGIYIQKDKKLTIYAQSTGSGDGLGGIEAYSSDGPGIGGMKNTLGGHLEIQGGYILGESQGNGGGAGIGGGKGEASGIQSITIYDGDVRALSRSNGGAGIGKGYHNNHSEIITIYGGSITVNNVMDIPETSSAGIGGSPDRGIGQLYIYGGHIVVNGDPNSGAGIGGGRGGDQGGDICIYGGYVWAKGGSNGAGIGGGSDGGKGGRVTITGGQVRAYGDYHGAGIGGGNNGKGGIVTITGGDVIVQSTYNGAGIGGGNNGEGGSVTITGGTVTADGGSEARAIGAGKNGSSHGSLEIGDELMVQAGTWNSATKQAKSNRSSSCRGNIYAEIETCNHNPHSYVINGTDANGTHTKTCNYCNHSFSPEQHTFSNGECTVCHVHGTVHTVTIYEPEIVDGLVSGWESTHYTVVDGQSFSLPATTVSNINSADNKHADFIGWAQKEATPTPGYYHESGETVQAEGFTFDVTSDATFYARYEIYWEGTGDGTYSNPICINDINDMNQLATRTNAGVRYTNKQVKLMVDLDYNGSSFTPIGRFEGEFDGNDKTISGLVISGNENVGLFSHIVSEDMPSMIYYLTLSNSTISGSSSVGGIVGNNDGVIVGCHVTNDVTIIGTTSGIGGIAGSNGGNIIGCTSEATLNSSASSKNGGIVGRITKPNAKVRYNFYLGNSISGTDNVGAIVGYNENSGSEYDESKQLICNYYINGSLSDSHAGCSHAYMLNVNTNYMYLGFDDDDFMNYGLVTEYFQTVLGYNNAYYAPKDTKIVFFPQAVDENKYIVNLRIANGGAGTLDPNGDARYTYTYGEGNATLECDEVSGPVFMTDGNWNDPENWSSETVPTSGTVIINAAAMVQRNSPVTIDGYVTLTLQGSITLADSAQFICNSVSYPEVTVRKNIKPASNWGSGDYIPDNWYLISSSLRQELEVEDVKGLVTTEADNDYDLYYLEEPTMRWKNYKVFDEDEDDILDPKAWPYIAVNKGYLYASQSGTTIQFTESIQPNVVGGVPVTLSKKDQGWNLVGNPFTFNAYVNKAYYKMNNDRTNIEAVEEFGASANTIAPCTGIIVQADYDDETIIFTKDAPSAQSNQGSLNFTLAQQMDTKDGSSTGSVTFDNAIVSFNEGNELEKFYLMEQSANLYIPKGTEEYAITSSEKQGEMPLNFKANKNGVYSLTVNPEIVEMGYLHLIDNLTGADVDLLATPIYTFNAKMTDCESRFRIVFSANDNDGAADGSETFAHFNGNAWNIDNEGEATLQVIDLLGHILSSQTINGSTTLGTQQLANGVYVMRLIQNENVKTQKIVVK